MTLRNKILPLTKDLELDVTVFSHNIFSSELKLNGGGGVEFRV